MIMTMLFKRRKTSLSIYENWMVFHLNKLESPSPKDALCQVWLKMAQWSLRRFLNFVKVFSLFRNYLLLEKGRVQLQSPLPKDALCQVWLKLAQRISRSFVNVFLLFHNYFPLEDNDDRQWTNFDQKSSLERSAQLNYQETVMIVIILYCKAL